MLNLLKNLAEEKKLPYNLIATVVALIIGVGGMFTYYQLSGISITTNNIIYAILMGFATALTSMNGFDKVKQAVEQLASVK